MRVLFEYVYDKNLVEKLCAIGEGLSDPQMDFIDSIADQVLGFRRCLTEKQRAVAEDILEKKGK